MAQEKIIEVQNLVLSFKTDHGILKAVRNISFDLYKGETLCIVGESGSGKSVTSKAIMGILAANAIVEGGHIYYRGEDLLEVAEEEFHKIRGHKIGMIFQDPLSSLNPIMRIGKQITEATLINSNKLKLLYEDLISEDLIAYKNCVARGRHKGQLLMNQWLKEKVDLTKKYDSNGISQANEEKKHSLDLINAKIKSEVEDLLEKEENPTSERVEAIKAEVEAKYKADQDAVLENYNKRVLEIKEAQAEKKQRLSELRAKKADIKAQIKEINAQTKAAAIPLKEKLDATKKAAKLKVKEYKENVIKEYNDKVIAIKQKGLSRQEEKKAIEAAQLEKTNKLKITKAEAKRRALTIMKEVGIPEPEKRFRQYPFEFSGGMRQRIVIAIALTETPEVLICDEPTTALDVTIQGQILELIKKIQRERNLSVIFITHDLGVVANMADTTTSICTLGRRSVSTDTPR